MLAHKVLDTSFEENMIIKQRPYVDRHADPSDLKDKVHTLPTRHFTIIATTIIMAVSRFVCIALRAIIGGVV